MNASESYLVNSKLVLFVVESDFRIPKNKSVHPIVAMPAAVLLSLNLHLPLSATRDVFFVA